MAGKYILTKYKPAATTSEVSRCTQMTDEDITQFEACLTDHPGRGLSRSRSFGNCNTFVSRSPLGPKRSYSSVNLSTQSCPEQCDEPTLVLETHRSYENSPNRNRTNHCHETQTIVHGQDSNLRQCEDSNCFLAAAAEQIVSGQGPRHVHYRNVTVSPNSNQQFYPTRNRYFNALDAAANIRSAMKKNPRSEGRRQRSAQVKKGVQGGMCVVKNRPLQRLRILNPTPKYYSASNSVESFTVGEPRCQDDIPQGLATVLGPRISPDMEFQIQKRAPRGLAAVVDRSCVETGQQTVEHYVSSFPTRESICQHEGSSSASNNSRVVTNIDVLENFKPDCEGAGYADSVCSSRTSIKVETDEPDEQMEILGQQQQQLQALQHQLQGLQQEQQLTKQQQFLLEQQQQLKEQQQQLNELQQQQQLKEQQQQLNEMQQQQQLKEQQQQLNALRQQQEEEALGEHDLLQCYAESLAASVNSCDDHNCDEFQSMEPPLLSSSSWEPAKCGKSKRVDTSPALREPELPSASSMSKIPHRHHHGCCSNACPSSKASVVSFNQSTIERVSGSGRSTSSARSRSSSVKNASTCGDSVAMIKAITEVREPKTLRNVVKNAVQHAVKQELCMQKAVQKAVHKELKMRSSTGDQCESYRLSEDESESEDSSSRRSDEREKGKRTRRSTCTLTPDEQNSIADLVVAARNSRSSSRSKSRSKRRMSSSSSGFYPRSVSLDASTSKGGRRNSRSPSGMSYRDRMASITQLLNSMNSVTQLLNSMPVQPDGNHPGGGSFQQAGSMMVPPGFMPGPRSSVSGSLFNPDPQSLMNSQGSFSQFPGQQPGGMDPQYGYDPNNPQQPGSKLMPGSIMGYDPNYPQQLRSQSMPSMGYNPGYPGQQPRSQSMPAMGFNGQPGQQGSMMGQRRSLRNSMQRRKSARRRSMDSDSGGSLSNIASTSEDITDVSDSQDVSDTIPEEDEASELPKGDSETPGDTGESGEQEGEEEGATGEGMAANYQPTIQSQTLGQMPQLLQCARRSSHRSSQNLRSVLRAMPHLSEMVADNPKTSISAQMVTKADMAKPNMPNEFQNHLSNMHSYIPRQFETQTCAKKSLSTIVEAMVQELEVLECMTRQKSAAYEFSSQPKQEYLPLA